MILSSKEFVGLKIIGSGLGCKRLYYTYGLRGYIYAQSLTESLLLENCKPIQMYRKIISVVMLMLSKFHIPYIWH